jgi:hypothetical protein
MLRDKPPSGRISLVKPVSNPFGFVNRVIENGYTTLEMSELKDFLLLSNERIKGFLASLKI